MLDYKMLIEPEEFVKECQAKHLELERNGLFNEDENENSMDGANPVDENFPFIRKGLKYNIKRLFYLAGMKIYTKRIAKYLNIKVTGKENLKKIKNKGAIITCNHISLFDSFAVRHAVGNDIMFVAAEFNNWKGEMGEVARHTGYIPVKNTVKCMRKFNEAMEYYLGKKKKILIYPEQAMWRNYTQPRPMKDGAFHYAAKHDAPILPLFITLEDSGERNQGGVIYHYTIHILEPIYPEKEISKRESTESLRKATYQAYKTCYEETYGKKVEYITTDPSKIEI